MKTVQRLVLIELVCLVAWGIQGAWAAPLITDGLSAYYSFNDDSGANTIAKDDSGNGHNGAVVGTVTGSATAKWGKSASILNTRTASPMDNYINVSGFANPPSTAITIAAWFNVNDLSGQPQDIFCAGKSLETTPLVHLELRSGLNIRFCLRSDSFSNLFNITTTGPDWSYGQWAHVAVTYDGATATVYCNGAFVGSKSGSGVIGSPWGSAMIGTTADTMVRGVNGLLDELYIFNRALSAEEVARLAVVPTLHLAFDNVQAVTPSLMSIPVTSGWIKEFWKTNEIVEDAHGYVCTGAQAVGTEAVGTFPQGILSQSTQGIFGGSLFSPTPTQLRVNGYAYAYANAVFVPTRVNGNVIPNIPTSELTFATWVNLANSTDHYRIFTCSDQYNNDPITISLRKNSGTLGYEIYLSGAAAADDSYDIAHFIVPDPVNGSVVTEQWVHLAVTFNKNDGPTGTVKVYRNGVEIYNQPALVARDLSPDWDYIEDGYAYNTCTVGAKNTFAFSCVGYMDDFYILPFAMTQDQIKDLAGLVPGDANLDHKVDVSDLGILAANYGSTGNFLNQGDFNGDGLVDVSDLGILAANYGTGTGAALDFNADAKAAGLTLGGEAQKAETSSLGLCGTAGLPLVIGLLLAAMWLGNFQLKK